MACRAVQVVQIIDHDPESTGGPVGVVDTHHGGVGVPAEPTSNEGRAMRPHNQAQPSQPPCYAPVGEDLDNDFYHEHSSPPK